MKKRAAVGIGDRAIAFELGVGEGEEPEGANRSGSVAVSLLAFLFSGQCGPAVS